VSYARVSSKKHASQMSTSVEQVSSLYLHNFRDGINDRTIRLGVKGNSLSNNNMREVSFYSNRYHIYPPYTLVAASEFAAPVHTLRKERRYTYGRL